MRFKRRARCARFLYARREKRGKKRERNGGEKRSGGKGRGEARRGATGDADLCKKLVAACFFRKKREGVVQNDEKARPSAGDRGENAAEKGEIPGQRGEKRGKRGIYTVLIAENHGGKLQKYRKWAKVRNVQTAASR